MRGSFFIKRAYINFFRNRFNNFSSIINVGVISFFSILLLFMLENSVEFVEQIVSKNSAAIILKNGSGSEDLAEVETLIKGEKTIERYTRISPDAAFEELRRNFSLSTDAVPIDPNSLFPHIFEIKFSRSIDRPTYDNFINLLKKTDGFEELRINSDLLELFFKIKKYSIYFRIIIFLILCISAFYILSNTIGLNLHNNRREEIELVELLGGDYLDIRIPYILEGMIIVGCGFLLGLAVALGSVYIMSPFIYRLFNMSLISFEPIMIGFRDIFVLFFILVISGLMGVIRFIRRFIRGLYEESI